MNERGLIIPCPRHAEQRERYHSAHRPPMWGAWRLVFARARGQLMLYLRARVQTQARSRMVQLSSLLVTGADGRWHPGIGDPGVVGWLTVVAYFAAAGLAYRALR